MTICDENGDGPYPDFRGWVQNHKNNTDWYKNKSNSYSSATVEDLALSTSDMSEEEINGSNNNQKQASPLGNKGNMTIANGATPDLAGNLTNANVSTGAITYYIDKWAGSSEWQEYKGGGLFNAGNRKIKVVQAADENYEEGVTEFTVTVQA